MLENLVKVSKRNVDVESFDSYIKIMLRTREFDQCNSLFEQVYQNNEICPNCMKILLKCWFDHKNLDSINRVTICLI